MDGFVLMICSRLSGGSMSVTPYYKEYNIHSDEKSLEAYTGIYVFDELTTTWKCKNNKLCLYYFKNMYLSGSITGEPTFAFILFDSQNNAKLITIVDDSRRFWYNIRHF